MSDNNKTPTDSFWSKNNPLVWVLICALLFVIYKRWAITVFDITLTPPAQPEMSDTSKTVAVPEKSIRVPEKPKHTKPTVPENPQSQPLEISPPPPIDKTPGTINTPPNQIADDMILKSLILPGNIVEGDGKAVDDAIIVCRSCLSSNTPVRSDQYGNFKIFYTIEYKEYEYPLKAIELSITRNGISRIISHNITQESLNYIWKPE